MSGASREALVATAGERIARGSTSFAMASRLFDRPTRERAWLLYAWCRRADDIADGQDHGGAMAAVGDPQARLAFITDMTERVLAGELVGDPAFDALGIVVRECAIPHHLPRDLVKGFAMDAAGFRPADEAELLTYCYHVAGVVGVMMAIVMGVSPDDEDTLARANDLGLAFQLANIARDIGEDAAAGRCYVPATWLEEFSLTPPPSSASTSLRKNGEGADDLMAPQQRAKLAKIGARLAAMAERYEASARAGAAALPFRARWAVLAAAGIYGDIAREVARRGEGAWDERVFTSRAAKLGWVIRALGQARASRHSPAG